MTPPQNDPPSNPLKGALTIIELTVKNARKLFESEADKEDESLDKYCTLKDNAGLGNNTSLGTYGDNDLKKFESGVYPASILLWIGTLKKGDSAKGYSLSMDAVEITTPAQQPAFFEGKLQIGNGQGILSSTRDVIALDAKQKYALYFTLRDPDGVSRQFKIDPILKGDTSSTQNYLHHLAGCLEIPVDVMIDDRALVQKINNLKEHVEKLLEENNSNK